MDKLLIIDFNGYYFNNRFIIKEFSKSKVLENRRVRSLKTSFVTKPPVDDISNETFENLDAYQNFYDATGIDWRTGTVEISALQRQLIYAINIRMIIYVETAEKAGQLVSFLGKHYNNIRALNSFPKFDFRASGLSSSCNVHRGINYHCAYARAIELAIYLYDNDILVQDNQSAVIDLNGYYDNDNMFILKELSIQILNPFGFTTYSNLFVVKPISPQVQNNYDVYYRKYGIPWNAGDYDLSHVFNELNDVIARSKNNLKIIFVRNKIIKNILRLRIFSVATMKLLSAEIVCLDEINYEEMMMMITDCRHHTIEDYFEDRCAGEYTKQMVKWIIKNEYFDFKKLMNRIYFNKIKRQYRFIDNR